VAGGKASHNSDQLYVAKWNSPEARAATAVKNAATTVTARVKNHRSTDITTSDIFRILITLDANCGFRIQLNQKLQATNQADSYPVRSTAALTFVGIVLIVGAVAPLAGYVPASRAKRADPGTALL
jgi:hypothetical protein